MKNSSLSRVYRIVLHRFSPSERIRSWPSRDNRFLADTGSKLLHQSDIAIDHGIERRPRHPPRREHKAPRHFVAPREHLAQHLRLLPSDEVDVKLLKARNGLRSIP